MLLSGRKGGSRPSLAFEQQKARRTLTEKDIGKHTGGRGPPYSSGTETETDEKGKSFSKYSGHKMLFELLDVLLKK
jgi:hypothetical protein